MMQTITYLFLNVLDLSIVLFPYGWWPMQLRVGGNHPRNTGRGIQLRHAVLAHRILHHAERVYCGRYLSARLL